MTAPTSNDVAAGLRELAAELPTKPVHLGRLQQALCGGAAEIEQFRARVQPVETSAPLTRATFAKDRNDPCTWVLYLLEDGQISVGKAAEWLREYINEGKQGHLPDQSREPAVQCVWRDGCRRKGICLVQGHCDAPLDMRRAEKSEGDDVADPAAPTRESWRCFHCDEVFTDRTAAREHVEAEAPRKFRIGDCVTVTQKGVVVGPWRDTEVVVRLRDGGNAIVQGVDLSRRNCDENDSPPSDTQAPPG